MKIVINVEYGGYGCDVAEEYEELVQQYEDDRTNPALVEFVENHPDECGDLKVKELPDNITDYIIEEYDGIETVYYVVNGKIHII